MFGNNEIELEGRADRVALHDKISASIVLYKPDPINYDRIKHYSVMEYIYRQLEMCDFTKLPESDIIARDLVTV